MLSLINWVMPSSQTLDFPKKECRMILRLEVSVVVWLTLPRRCLKGVGMVNQWIGTYLVSSYMRCLWEILLILVTQKSSFWTTFKMRRSSYPQVSRSLQSLYWLVCWTEIRREESVQDLEVRRKSKNMNSSETSIGTKCTIKNTKCENHTFATWS